MIKLIDTYTKKEVVRYEGDDIDPSISDVIERIDFQTTTDKNGQMLVYFKEPYGVANVEKSKVIGDFIKSRSDWKGDRSNESIGAEIYIHWVAENMRSFFMLNSSNEFLWKNFIIGGEDSRTSPIFPIHVGYTYEGLETGHPMDQFLMRI
ncbi:MAG: hypothetical protein WC877_00870 [Dehalococcoidales bacterium]|jgi:hypothetical protein